MANFDKEATLAYLDEQGIAYEKMEHKAVFTMEEMDEVLSLMKARNPLPTEVLILPGCNHGNGMYKQTEMFQGAIRDFIFRYL